MGKHRMGDQSPKHRRVIQTRRQRVKARKAYQAQLNAERLKRLREEEKLNFDDLLRESRQNGGWA